MVRFRCISNPYSGLVTVSGRDLGSGCHIFFKPLASRGVHIKAGLSPPPKDIVGPGVFAGIIAIGLRSIGFCAKLLYEAIEEIDENQVEAVTATGARGPQVLAYGIVPQVLPAFAGISVFRWDTNIRESTILGLVGLGPVELVCT